MKKTLIVLTSILVLSVALAQVEALPEAAFDPAAWFGSTAALAAIVVAAVAFLKRNIITNMSGWITIAFSFGLAIVAAVAGSFTSLYDATVIQAVTFGGSAGLLASGGWDAVRGLLGKR
jgi:cellobiose-specific phosphotransferase system component IIC